MSNKSHSVTVVLDKDYKDEDLDRILNAIGMVKGVLALTPHEVDFHSMMAEERAKAELREKLFELIIPKGK